jgi:hypothetical protein
VRAPKPCDCGGPPPEVRRALDLLLVRIGSWTHSRWDQHLRYEFGDEFANKVINWLTAHADIPEPKR